MRRWRVGMVGYGWAAGAHIGALELIDRFEVAAVCTSREDVDAAELERIHGHPIELVRDVDELIARPDIDVIDLCSRSNLHASQAITAARAGKHLIIEKPIALDLEGMRAVEAAVKESGVRTCVCLQVRFSPQFTMTRSLVGGGLIGPLHYGEVDYFHNIGPEVSQYEWNLRSDGGGSSLLTAGCHALDGLMLFMDGDVTEVTSYATSSPHPNFSRYEYPTSSVTILRFASGALGKVASIVDSHQPYYLRVHLVGAEGTILDGKLWSKAITGLDPDRWTELGVQLESLNVVDEPYLLQFQEFADALEGDREMALTSLADSVRTFEVVFAADRSAELGRAVPMSEISP
jgi:predicted dehydrogenase